MHRAALNFLCKWIFFLGGGGPYVVICLLTRNGHTVCYTEELFVLLIAIHIAQAKSPPSVLGLDSNRGPILRRPGVLTSELRYTPLSYAATSPKWAMPQLPDTRHTPLSNATPYWVTPHPCELRLSSLSYATPLQDTVRHTSQSKDTPTELRHTPPELRRTLAELLHAHPFWSVHTLILQRFTCNLPRWVVR